MVKRVAADSNRERFAGPPWTKDSAEWQALDRRLPTDHLARRIERAVQMLDLDPLFASYLGVGKKALPADLLLKAVLYEMHSKRPSPAQWAKDVRESEPVRWLLFGIEPWRARLYDFRDRLAPFWQEWNAQVLHVALEENLTPATRVALDGSSVAANASRRHLLNEEGLQKRLQVIDASLQRRQRGETVSAPPAGANLRVPRRAPVTLYQDANATALRAHGQVVPVRLPAGTLPGVSASTSLYADSGERADGEPHGKRKTVGRAAGAHANARGQEAL
jgi:transposase